MAEVVYQCPQCGSPAVDCGELVGADAKCRVCGWKGQREELLATPFNHMMGTKEGIGFEMSNDIRRLFSLPIFLGGLGGFLNRWGFIDPAGDGDTLKRNVTRYVATMARAVMIALLEERDKIEKERNGE